MIGDKNVSIKERADWKVSVKVGTESYLLTEDKWTGDWMAVPDPPNLSGTFLLSRDDAILYVLYQEGVIDEARYERAPERCV